MTMHELHTFHTILGPAEPVRTLGDVRKLEYPLLKITRYRSIGQF
jgi:hypothetical protein